MFDLALRSPVADRRSSHALIIQCMCLVKCTDMHDTAMKKKKILKNIESCQADYLIPDVDVFVDAHITKKTRMISL